ncbi:hypothetical protein ACFQ38_06055 [Sporosarcina contaminans]|uniref:Uncharacterized protein n=1 Tax=Sporosarcina contaminans TaxID=633403 RepID=A0ABW3TVK2_9BACL
MKIGTMLGLIIVLIVFINFVYQTIRLFKGLSKQMYDEDTVHRFQCGKCGEMHSLKGPEMKKLRRAPRIEKSTFGSQSTAIVFKCPHCHKRTSQIVQFDTNVTKGAGMVRVQMNEEQKPLIVQFLVRGILPFILLSMVYRFFA